MQPPQAAPDIRSVEADLQVPPLTSGPPAAGRRVKHRLPEHVADDVYHVLYLPDDYIPGEQYPVIVEFAGNGGYRSAFGDVSHGVPEGSRLGYGISEGSRFLWLCLPFLTADVPPRVATTWWGNPPDYDVRPTVAYAKQAVDMVCTQFGGRRDAVFLCGFSRGAIACNLVGLHDDEIAACWRGFVAYSHYDGVRDWDLPGADAESARIRLERLDGRPQFICHESLPAGSSGGLRATRRYLAGTEVEGDFTFAETGFRNHNDAWILRPSACRDELRQWIQRLLLSTPPDR